MVKSNKLNKNTSVSFTWITQLTVSLCCTETIPIDHDEEVEDDVEYTDTELGGVEEHKSIILHLLSQLKLGMDLTKVCFLIYHYQ